MNAVAAEHEKSDVVELRATGPGERLRNARVSRDMDIAKVAGQLHLTVDLVEALECDDYSELPARVFVRGYLRNYARLVDLPVDSILAQFDDLWPEDQDTVKIERAPRLPADQRPGRNWASGVTWLLVIAGIVLFLMWWQGYLDRFTAQVEEAPTTPAVGIPADIASEQSQAAMPVAPPPPAPAQAAEEQASPQLLEGPGLLALPPARDNQAETTAPVAPQAQADTSPAAALASVDAGAQETPGVAGGETTPPVTTPGIVVSFREDCWVDIRGSERSFKLFGTMRKGTQRTLDGQPPFKFVLGNAAAVEIRVNGEPFDLGPHTRDNVARFTLSP
jgi:cytoskeleton protein RodZ